MKKLTKLLVLTLVFALTLTALVACDKSGSIKKDFEEAGYTVEVISAKNEKAKPFLKDLSEEEIDEIEEYELILCEKSNISILEGIDLNGAIIVKYPSAAELKEELIDEGGKAYYDEQVEAGKVRGNCWLRVAYGDADDIFAGK